MKNVPVETQEEISAEDMFGGKGKEVTVVSESGAVAIFNPSEIRYYSSLPSDTMESKALILKALGNSDYTLKSVAEKKVVMLQNIIAHGIELTNEAGELEHAARIVFVLENGETLSGCSKGFKSSVTNLMAIYGQPPYADPLPIVVRDVTTRKGNNTFNLSVAGNDCTLPRVGGKK